MIDELKEWSVQTRLSFLGDGSEGARLDLDGLVLSGHSFGGAAAISTADRLRGQSYPAALILLDPWTLAVSKRIS